MADSCKKLFGIVEKHLFERRAGEGGDHGAQLFVEERGELDRAVRVDDRGADLVVFPHQIGLLVVDLDGFAAQQGDGAVRVFAVRRHGGLVAVQTFIYIYIKRTFFPRWIVPIISNVGYQILV